jgi:hypothetical protein
VLPGEDNGERGLPGRQPCRFLAYRLNLTAQPGSGSWRASVSTPTLVADMEIGDHRLLRSVIEGCGASTA